MFVLGSAGHVDHGKSTLLQFLSGQEPDRLPEEKRRCMTIDLNFVWIDSQFGRIGIVDVPGHKKYLGNMVTGTTNIDAFLFIVAANDGWMPQSEEHFRVLRALRIHSGVCIITKTDLCTEKRTREVEFDVKGRFVAAFGNGVSFHRFSIRDPGGIEIIKEAIEDLLVQLPKPRDNGWPRLWVDRVFSPRGLGTVVTGTLREGSLRVGDEVRIWPANRGAVIKSLQCFQAEVQTVSPVTRVAVQLSRVEREHVERGALIESGKITRASKCIYVKGFPLSGDLKDHAARNLDVCTCKRLVRWVQLESSDFAKIFLSEEIPVRSGDPIILRTVGEEKTVAGAVVIDPSPIVRSHRRALADLSLWDGTARGFVQYRINNFLPFEPLYCSSTFLEVEIGEALKGLDLKVVGKILVRELDFEIWKNAILETLRNAHERGDGVGLSEIRVSLKQLSDELIGSILNSLIQTSFIRKQGNHYFLYNFFPKVSKDEQGVLQVIIQKGGGLPLSLRETGLESKSKIIWNLVKSGALIALGNDYFLDSKSYERAKEMVKRGLLGRFASTSELKLLLNTSRKNAVLILEKMDRDRLTYFKDGVRGLLGVGH